ncbi:hypothetical protein [Nocardia sp. N2S4-5]|uniref:hypothetical protein n=1 Tax=Nocardia sp. N2S4-5 TaxID=3351565 RepID=UPI0037D7F834
MDALAVAEYAAIGGVAAVTASGVELLQFARKQRRWPWRAKGEKQRKGVPRYVSFQFWLVSNLILRAVIAATVVGLQAAAGWIVNIGAAVVIGAGSTFTLSATAASRDTGYEELPEEGQ